MIRSALLAAAIATASLAVPAAADARTVVINANGYTIDAVGRLQRFSTLIVDDQGRVEGTRQDGNLIPDADRVLDAEGATLLPGLIDAHGHIMGLGETLRILDLSGTSSLDEALRMLADYAAANPDLDWITGRGWNQVNWDLADFPTAADLDGVVPNRPVVLERVDGHATWANSAAIALANIAQDMADPDGGQVIRDADGRMTGVFVDTASAPLYAAIGAPDETELAARLQAALDAMAATGMTAAADMGVTADAFDVMKRFAANGRMTARIAAYAAGMDSLMAIAPEEPTGWMNRDRLALLGVKLYVDGALGSRGARLMEPYSDAPDRFGLWITTGAQLRNQMVLASQAGHQLAIHAIGDAANREVLDAVSDVQRYLPVGRPRIEHAQVVALEDLPRFGELGVIASVQPTHATSDKNMAEDRIGPERLKGAYAWRSLVNSGARLALGSDFPVEPVEPLFGLHAAITRKDRDGNPSDGWIFGEALSPAEALTGFTVSAAYAMQAEGRFGTLTPGKWADFILVDGDPLADDPDGIWDMTVLQTWVGGELVYSANQ
ncbi:MAG: amidohydrolase family protein [Pacificimonas sp.]|jgi:predicted amidohydrolase YtcJ|nr:amidohydrolase family protein [Pacificimonas sp.]